MSPSWGHLGVGSRQLMPCTLPLIHSCLGQGEALQGEELAGCSLCRPVSWALGALQQRWEHGECSQLKKHLQNLPSQHQDRPWG